MCRCRACDAILTTYELTLKRTIDLGNGQSKEVYEDLCGRCRGEIRQIEEEEVISELFEEE